MEYKINCPVCDSAKVKIMYEHMEDLTFKVTKEKFNLFNCNNCDAKFQYPLIPENEVSKYYPGENYHPFNLNPIIIPHNNKKNPQSVYLKYLLKHHKKQDSFSLIDVGCGGGNFLYSVKHYFPNSNVIGVDVSEIAIKNLKKINIDGIHSSLYNFESSSKFDYIISSQVLEHLNKPHDFIKKIISISHPNSVFMIDVPASDSYSAKKYKRFWVHWDLPRHSIIYSKKSLLNLFNNYFKTINISHAGTLIAIRSSKKISKGKNIYTQNFLDKIFKYTTPITKLFGFLYSDKIYWIGKIK